MWCLWTDVGLSGVRKGDFEFLLLFTFLKALISASIKCFGVRRPEDNAILLDKSRSAMLFHISCSSFVRIWHQMRIISLTFSSSLRLSWITLAAGSLEGNLNFAFAGVIFAASVGTVTVSKSSCYPN